MYLPYVLAVLQICFIPAHAVKEPVDVYVALICQKDPLSQKKCEHVIELEEYADDRDRLTVHKYTDDHDWSIFPVIPTLNVQISTASWIVFGTEHTSIKLTQLIVTLGKFDDEQEIFVGHALMDPEPTIIHHFSSNSHFQFPLIHAGFALSRPLFNKLVTSLMVNGTFQSFDFSIDASYEFASYLSDFLNVPLTDSRAFCIKPSHGCATWSTLHQAPPQKLVEVSEIAFAVKTCEKYHKNRVKAVKKTWGAAASRITYYSDVLDNEVPTVLLDVTHTEHGHCQKSRALLNETRTQFRANPQLKWVVITDDDTILSVQRIRELVSYYNPSLPVAIGERYGYNLQGNEGYNYLTGGGGVIVSRAALMLFRKKSCLCPSASTPDDMYIFGICFRKLGITLIHTPLMHQARDSDYSADYLALGAPVSFHKHWMVNPHDVYEKWFYSHDHSYHDEF